MSNDDIFPRRNLPGPAEQWGREVENRIRGAELNLEVLQQFSQSSNRNTASSLATLGAQILDLSGRTSQFQTSTDLLTFTAPTTYGRTVIGPTLTVAPPGGDARLVRIRATVFINNNAYSPASSLANPTSQVRLDLRINGVDAATQNLGYDDSRIEVPSSSTEQTQMSSRRLVVETYLTLTDETTFQAQLQPNFTVTQPGAYNSTIYASDPTISTDILQFA